MFDSFNTASISLLGGVLPALFWLWFWLKEDRVHPEPKKKIALVFILGAVSVFLVIPIERFIFDFVGSISSLTIILWAAAEEIFKFFAAFFALRSKTNDEPIDAIIYMITAALGFSAIENSLFLSNLINSDLFVQSLLNGNSRFIGATVLHIASSSSIGVMIGLSFYKNARIKKIFLFTGLLVSIILHTIFNLLIINIKTPVFIVFSAFWVLIIVLVVLIEKIKTTKFDSSLVNKI
jgi:RsiW-degrading membrane proteinase PrsW (M82 family)